jgi:hypothetical protein
MRVSINNQALKLDIEKLESPYSQTVFGEIQIDVPVGDDGHFKTITLRGAFEMAITSHQSHLVALGKLLSK